MPILKTVIKDKKCILFTSNDDLKWQQASIRKLQRGNCHSFSFAFFNLSVCVTTLLFIPIWDYLFQIIKEKKAYIWTVYASELLCTY